MRSDKPFDATAFERLMTPEAYAHSLNRVIGQIEDGTIPRSRIHDLLFADLMAQPQETIVRLYQQMGLQLSEQASSSVLNYLSQKPQGKFGKHQYSVGERDQIASERKIFVRYQQFHHVPEEV